MNSRWISKEVEVEHIGKVLANFHRETAILNPKIIEPEPDEPTLEERRKEIRQSLGVSSLANTFENFKPMKGTAKALAAFKALAYGKSRRKMLLIYGGVGSGKTHLCEATVIALYKQGIFCRVLTMARIMRALKCAMHGDSLITYEELLDTYCECKRLIIDDVGMGGSGSEWEYGQLEEIITARYRERLFTILTTNRDISELPERITSRFFDPDVGTVVLNEAGDFRKSKLKGGEM